MSASWLHGDVRRDVSSIQGEGLFAGRDFHAGEIVQRIGGQLMSEAKFRLAIRELTNYNGLQVGEDEHLLDPTPGHQGMNFGSSTH